MQLFLFFLFFKFKNIFSITKYVCFSFFSKICKKISGCSSYYFSEKLFEKFYTLYVIFFKFSKSLILDWSILNEKVIKFNISNKIKKAALSFKQDAALLLYVSFFKTREFVDLTAVDFLGKSEKLKQQRFSLYYVLNSYANKVKYLLNFHCAENSLVYSLNSLYPSISWAERECWDMFGIRFKGNLDLRRILTDYGFRGFPLRKDFPVVGFKQVRFDELADSVIYENLFLMQDERESVFVNPWSATFHVGLSSLSGVLLHALRHKISSYLNLLIKN